MENKEYIEIEKKINKQYIAMIDLIKEKYQSDLNDSMLIKIAKEKENFVINKQNCLNDYRLEIFKLKKNFSDLPFTLNKAIESSKKRFENRMNSIISSHKILIENFILMMR